MIHLLVNKDNVIIAISSTIRKINGVYITAENKKFSAKNLSLVALDRIPENTSTITYGYTKSLGVHKLEKDFEESLPIGSLTEAGLTKRPTVSEKEDAINIDNTWQDLNEVSIGKLTTLVTSGETKLPSIYTMHTYSQRNVLKGITLPKNQWIGESAPYTNTVAVNGANVDKLFTIHSGDKNDDRIYHIICNHENELTFYSSKLPREDITVNVLQF